MKPLLSSSEAEDITFPEGGWVNLKTAVYQEGEFCFTSAEKVSYFISRSVSDGFPADDFKDINKKAKILFICRHTVH